MGELKAQKGQFVTKSNDCVCEILEGVVIGCIRYVITPVMQESCSSSEV